MQSLAANRYGFISGEMVNECRAEDMEEQRKMGGEGIDEKAKDSVDAPQNSFEGSPRRKHGSEMA